MRAWFRSSAGPCSEQVDQTVGISQQIVPLHLDRKALISDLLSFHVVNATGQLKFASSSAPEGPVLWLDHDLVANQLS
ncbi:enoyl ACP reductase FabMG family protein [Aliiruegeria sabulilitoris]|uniref:enoyl ACP reductase FabMG family protein n=1 Tax=Aliiruegeria sabulilitoris TaxID=1510458 RepID=UPI003F69D9F9